MLSLLLLNVACVEKLDGPPPKPSKRNRMDTAYTPDEVDEDGRDLPPKFDALKLTGATDADTPAGLTVKVSDPEGNMVRTTITWFVNGNRISGVSGTSLDDEHFVSGQRIKAEVVATDGVNKVRRVTVERTVGNQPPEISMGRIDMSKLDGLQVVAKDPDGGPLEYRMEDGPPGMSIDAKGVVHWSGAVDTAGSWTPRVIVADGMGDEATWEFEVQVTAGVESKTMKESEARREGLIE